jgi:hypothetical protein
MTPRLAPWVRPAYGDSSSNTVGTSSDTVGVDGDDAGVGCRGDACGHRFDNAVDRAVHMGMMAPGFAGLGFMTTRKKRRKPKHLLGPIWGPAYQVR